MRVLVTGKNGQLGRSINKIINERQYNDDFVFVDRHELNYSKDSKILKYFENNFFDVIINCAAYTKVDEAEKEFEIANQINHLSVKKLAEIAKKQKAKIIHISTDYVFDGKNSDPYIETDMPNPINNYGKTKLAGELALIKLMPTDAIIIRTSWLYSEFGDNFFKTILKLGTQKKELSIVSDQLGAPTYASDLAHAILEILQNNKFKTYNQKTQIYHYSNEGQISWYDFTKKIFEKTKVDCHVKSIKAFQYQSLSERPINTTLNNNKIMNVFGLKISNWEISLNNCLLSNN